MTEESENKLISERGALSRLSSPAAVVLILLPAALGYLYVYLFGVNVVYGDEWRIANLFEKLASDKLKLAHLFAQLNEHRIFVPRVIILSLGSLTKWNTVAEMYVTQTLLLVTLFVLFVAFSGSIRSRSHLLLFAPVSFLVFSLRQDENMLMGLLMQFVLVLTFAVVAFYFLQILRRKPSSKLAFPAALVSATLASLSSAQGLLVWPVGFAQLLVSQPSRRAKWFLVGSWSIFGVAEWVAYFLGYHTHAQTAANRSGDLAAGPLYFLRFFLTLMGSSLSSWPGPALAVGALLLILAVATLLVATKNRNLAENSFFASLALFAFLILLSITVGRAERGIEQALVSRYTTYSILGVVGLYGMLAKLYLETRSRVAAVAFAALIASVLLSLPVAYTEGIEDGHANEVIRQRAAYVLATYKSQPDIALRSLYPNPEFVRKRAPVLERLGYNVFSDSGQ